jgi:hypothetical protein
MPKSVAKVNKETNIVENIIIIEDGDVIEGYYLVDIPKDYDSSWNVYVSRNNINIGDTKWFPNKGFVDLDGMVKSTITRRVKTNAI